jgi:glucose/arabinose dehydrogenase
MLAAAALLAAAAAAGAQDYPPGWGPHPDLPAPTHALLPTVQIAPAVPWQNGARPRAAQGMQVAPYAIGLAHPRWLYVLPNGDVLVAETNAPPKPDDAKGLKGMFMKAEQKRAGALTDGPHRITLLRGVRPDGMAAVHSVFLTGLHSPFGMTLVGNELYVADTDALLRFPYTPGATAITAAPVKVADLPAGTINHHWTKNVIASPDGKTLYVTVGSNSNVGENGIAAEQGRAAIWEFDRATGKGHLYATGLRNPNGMAFHPETGVLWTVVNERDELGNDLPPISSPACAPAASTAGPTATTAGTWTRAHPASVPTSSPAPSCPTTPWAGTRPRSGWRSTAAACSPS